MAINKKGTEMIWIIVWLVLGLIVMFILLGIVTGKLRIFGETGHELEDKTLGRLCAEQGGACYDGSCPGDAKDEPAPAAGWIDCPSPSICCIPK